MTKRLIDYEPLLDTQRELVRQQDEVAQSRGQVAVDLVAVYKALAGGWKVRLGDAAAAGGPDSLRIAGGPDSLPIGAAKPQEGRQYAGGPDSLPIGAAQPQEDPLYATKTSCAYGTPIGKLSGPPTRAARPSS